MMGAAHETARAWCFTFEFKGKKPCMFGTVFCRLGAPHHEVEAACIEAWFSVFPKTFPPPPIVKLIPGTLVFLPKEDSHV